MPRHKTFPYFERAGRLPKAGRFTMLMARIFGRKFVGADVSIDGATKTTVYYWLGRTYVDKIEHLPPPDDRLTGKEFTFIAYDELGTIPPEKFN